MPGRVERNKTMMLMMLIMEEERQYKEMDARESGKKQDDDVNDVDYGRRKTIQRNRCQEEWKKNKMTLLMTEEEDNKSK
jgi:hypothetical protein